MTSQRHHAGLRARSYWGLIAAAVLCAWVSACGDGELRPLVRARPASSAGMGANSSSGADSNGGAASAGLAGVPGLGEGGACPSCSARPIVVAPLDPAIVARFGPVDSRGPSGGPCLNEPENGSLFPRNVPPRFSWNSFASPTAVELRLHFVDDASDLVVYTAASSWIMDEALGAKLAANALDQPIRVDVRSLALGDPTAVPLPGRSISLTIAPADATGVIAYSAGGQAIRALELGAAQPVTLIQAKAGRCVSCHSTTPGNTFLAYSEAEATDLPDGQLGSVRLRLARDGVTPATIATASAHSLLAQQSQHHAAFSPSHWAAGDFRALLLSQQRLIWANLEATSAAPDVGWGVLARRGDPGQAASTPQWSHDGKFIVYASGSGTDDGGIVSAADLYRLPYDAGRGGTATPIAGANEATYNEYYPSISPDDALLAYARAPAGDSLQNAAAELFVVPTSGGSPVRLVANDPCACLAKHSPGVTNSWPKWAPAATVIGGRVIYWLAFSSHRETADRAQIYVTPVVRETTGMLSTYPAIRVGNQSEVDSNYAPSWSNLQLPAAP